MFRTFIFLFLIQASCVQLPIKMADRQGEAADVASDNHELDPSSSQNELPGATKNIRDKSVAVIVGPSSPSSIAAASGLLKYLHANEIKISYIVGLGLGSLPAAFYAHKAKPHEGDWHFFKLEKMNFKKTFFFNNSRATFDEEKLSQQLEKVFKQKKIENFQVPFVCAQSGLSRGSFRLQTQGRVVDGFEACLKQEQAQNYSDSLNSYKELIAFLYNQGADFVVYLNTAVDNDSNVFESSSLSGKQLKQYNFLAELNSSFAGLTDFTFTVKDLNLNPYSFSETRSTIMKGSVAAKKQMNSFLKALKQHQ